MKKDFLFGTQRQRIFNDIVQKELNLDRSNIDIVLQKLRDRKASQVDSVKALMSVGYSLKEADNIILSSDIWKDYYDYNIKLRETFFEVMGNSN